jgi:hypothetical protein
VNVHLKIGLGASNFGVKGELRLVDALGVHIFEPPWLWTAQPNRSDSEIRFGRLRRRPLRGRIATSEGWWQWHGCPSGEWNITWLLLDLWWNWGWSKLLLCNFSPGVGHVLEW